MSPEELAKRMREWRGTATQAEAAEALGLSKRTIEGIEARRGFALAKLLLIAMQHTTPKRETT